MSYPHCADSVGIRIFVGSDVVRDIRGKQMTLEFLNEAFLAQTALISKKNSRVTSSPTYNYIFRERGGRELRTDTIHIYTRKGQLRWQPSLRMRADRES